MEDTSTVIKIKRSTVQLLLDRKCVGETYDIVIKRLIKNDNINRRCPN
jgi:hypothetical protein